MCRRFESCRGHNPAADLHTKQYRANEITVDQADFYAALIDVEADTVQTALSGSPPVAVSHGCGARSWARKKSHF